MVPYFRATCFLAAGLGIAGCATPEILPKSGRRVVVVGGGGTVLVKASADQQFKKVPYPGYGNLVSVLPLSDTEVLLFGARGAQPLKVR